MLPPSSAADLSIRQAVLQADAAAVLAELDLGAILADADAGPMHLTGSYVSGLMCWPDLDVMAHVGAAYTPRDVLRLLQRIVEVTGVVGFCYRDERGPRSPTGTRRDERYHLPITLSHNGREWRLDLTLWLNDPHVNLTAWHERLRENVTGEQRSAILRIKDVWHRLPSYPDRVGGMQIYTAVIDDGVRSPGQFATWLSDNGYPPA